jgi:hypothetical protein
LQLGTSRFHGSWDPETGRARGAAEDESMGLMGHMRQMGNDER